MLVKSQICANEIEQIKEHSYYNNIMWRFTKKVI